MKKTQLDDLEAMAVVESAFFHEPVDYFHVETSSESRMVQFYFTKNAGLFVVLTHPGKLHREWQVKQDDDTVILVQQFLSGQVVG